MKYVRNGLGMGLITFVLAIIVVSLTRLAITALSTIFVPLVLFIIISMGIIFDTIGVAALAANEAAFNAKAARKVFGARHGLNLVRNADKVATFCNDIVGDICGTVSGSLGALLVLRLVVGNDGNEALLNLLMIAGIAALTVGGKGFGKSIGMRNANNIIERVGVFLAQLERVFGFKRAKGGVNRK